MRTLFIHPGWSKTGSSAIQKALNSNFDKLRERGILYSKELQMFDHAHHKLALSFQSSGPYSSPITAEHALHILGKEMTSHSCVSAILSSELSPFYFDYPVFIRFMQQYFDVVRIIFTVRRQSDLLLSLFSQPVIDPTVRYQQSLFFPFLKNIHHLDYYAQVSRWSSADCAPEIIVVPYSQQILPDFLSIFGLDAMLDASFQNVNKSIDPKHLLVVQHECRHASTPPEFSRRMQQTLQALSGIEAEPGITREALFSAAEQRAVDDYFQPSNTKLFDLYGQQCNPFSDDYKSVFAFSSFTLHRLARG